MPRICWIAVAALGAMFIAATPALAQSNIHPDHKFAWGENVGWTNWRDADGTNAGVVVGSTFMGGLIWAENVGWINVGDGDPADGIHYANLDDTDFGVNIDASTDELFGYGWGENIGWVNFAGGALADPPNAARLENDCRLRGYVWGENVGWLNLDDEEHFVVRCLDGDIDYDGDIDLADLAQLLASYGLCEGEPGYDPAADLVGGDDCVTIADLAELLSVYGTVCP